ncbi:hypothetical protein Cfor_10970, partial [Coptotermes formosanus]
MAAVESAVCEHAGVKEGSEKKVLGEGLDKKALPVGCIHPAANGTAARRCSAVQKLYKNVGCGSSEPCEPAGPCDWKAGYSHEASNSSGGK